MARAWIWAYRRMRRDLDTARIPHPAMASAFSLTAMVFALPLPGGTTGHICRAALVSVVLGPWACVVAISVALIIQAFVFGDGGNRSTWGELFRHGIGWWIRRLLGFQAGCRRRFPGTSLDTDSPGG